MMPLVQTQQDNLISYGMWLLARQLGALELADLPGTWPLASDARESESIERARRLLNDVSDEAAPAGPEQLPTIFSFVRYPGDRRPRIRVDAPRRELTTRLDRREDRPAAELWAEFDGRLNRLPAGWSRFESFVSLLARYGWYVPGTLEAEGVSVFEQFKMVAALAHILASENDEVLLVAGDLPGIQDVLYTITSSGAAKSLRGRSFYLQLLNDAIVRAALRELHLPSTCVVFNAGGNFQLLARSTDAEALQALREEINSRLLDLHGGELFLALAWTAVDASRLSTHAFSEAVREVGRALDKQKNQAFVGIVEEDYESVFGAIGVGGTDRCDVCYVDLPPGVERCSQCRSLEDLARDIAKTNRTPVYSVGDLHGFQATQGRGSWRGRPEWFTVLRAFGYEYRFADDAHQRPGSFFYRLNDTDCIPEQPVPDCAYGFRFLANTTPRITSGDDLRAIQAAIGQEEEPIREGEIRSTSVLAGWDSAGIDRYGVLRMDVDDLGTLFSERLVTRHILHTSALSAALTLFFEGWLNHVCEEVAREWNGRASEVTADKDATKRSKLPYVIYAGGDDLLIVGPWDVLPRLAARIRRDLGNFVLHGYVREEAGFPDAPLTVSAGVFAGTSRFPLYRAADQAGEALSRAKRRTAQARDPAAEPEIVKDAIHFLETTLGWEQFREAETFALHLARLVDRDGAPRALIQMLNEVAEEYRAAGGDAALDRPVYGRWMPLLAYGLKRMWERVPRANESLRHEIMRLGGAALDLTSTDGAANWQMIRILAMPVRWAEFLTRRGR
ncbi:MAG: type III-A CRISPR-associated protein Cas10/Csm1 [Gemmatimonadetes bacterium]|nr:type III-A CRISPR-associated protein Cas10/Csm1 [Gemmatimonadota bacterium]